MKHIRKLAVLAIVAVLALTILCSCGKAESYKYDSVSVEFPAIFGEDAGETNKALESMYDTMFKDTTLEIKSKTATLIIDDQRNEMKMKKDGDKYTLSGDYVARMEKMFTGAEFGEGVEVKIDLYLTKTDNGYDYVVEETVMGMAITVKLHYVK